MTIADTSVWIEYLRSREPVHGALKSLLEAGEVLGVECIFGELLSGARGKHEQATLQSFWNSLPRLDETGIWLEAGKLSAAQGLPAQGIGLVDAAIIAAARKTGARIWTLDRNLEKAARETRG